MNSAVRDPRIDIAQTVYRFAYGIDARHWDEYRSIFVEPDDEIIFDYESYSGRPAMSMTRDRWLEVVTPLFNGLDATQHTMSNPLVEIDAGGRDARCRMYMQAAHFLWSDDGAEPEFTIGGYYDDHLVLDDSGNWKIDAVRLIVWWRRGDEEIVERARRRSAS